MKLKFKKAVAAMLSITFLCSTMAPSINSIKLVKPALIADAAGSCTSFDEATGTLTLSGNVVKEEVQAWAGNQNVKKVTCAEGTVLPADCSYLFRRKDWRYTSYFYAEELDFSNADTSNVTNMQGMFFGFDNLIHIDLTGFDTSNVTNMANMFGSCDNLEYVDLTGFDTANVTDMSDMFVYCKSLKELDLSSFDTSNVTEMPFMFCNCENMEYLDLKTFNFENVTSMKWMFTNCYKLKNIYFDNDIDTSNVINMDSLFHSCFELQSLDLTSFNTRNVTEMEGMFCNCMSLPDLDLCSFDTSNVTNMDSMFCSCAGLEAIYGLDHFDTCNVKSMRWMFSGCRLLESLDLSSFDTSNVNNMEAMFCSCKSIRELDLSTFDTSTVIYMGDMFSYCDSLTKIFVSSKWTTKSLILDDRYHDESEIFLDDTNLVGGNGTSYDPSRVGHEMACIDTPQKSGYLSSAYRVNVDDIKTGIEKYGTSCSFYKDDSDNYHGSIELNAGGYFLGKFKLNNATKYYDITFKENNIAFNIYTKDFRGNYHLVEPAENYNNTYRLKGSRTYYIQAYEMYLIEDILHWADAYFNISAHVDKLVESKGGIWYPVDNESFDILSVRYIPKDKVEAFYNQLELGDDLPDDIKAFKEQEEEREERARRGAKYIGSTIGTVANLIILSISKDNPEGGLLSIFGAGGIPPYVTDYLNDKIDNKGNHYDHLKSNIYMASNSFDNGIMVATYNTRIINQNYYSVRVYEWDGKLMQGANGCIGTFEVNE